MLPRVPATVNVMSTATTTVSTVRLGGRGRRLGPATASSRSSPIESTLAAGRPRGGRHNLRPVQGLMQQTPLTLPMIFRRAERLYGEKLIITSGPQGRVRMKYSEWTARTRRLGTVLDTLGISADG